MSEAESNNHPPPPPPPHEQRQPLHCVMVPHLAMGHIIPMVDLGMLMAEQGVSVTLFTTPANAKRLDPAFAQARAASLPFTVTALPFQVEGLPDGSDNFDLTSTIYEAMKMLYAMGELEAPFREHLKGFDLSRTFMMPDFLHSWTRNVSRDLGIPRYIFYSVPCFTLHCHRVLQRYYDSSGGGVGEDDATDCFVVPGIPHTVELDRARAPGFLPMPDLREQVDAAEETADGMVVNTFAALEGEYLQLYEKEVGKPVWPVGPVSLYSRDLDRAAVRGNKPSSEVAQILNWLDSQKPRSVLYLCRGSLAQTTPEQVSEIGLGLEASGHPFLWVIRTGGAAQMKEVESWLAAGFEDRTKGRGLVLRGWAPQHLILSHPAIGGFLTHCGWNSISEALAFGVPLATWPFGSDQFVNERFLVDVLCVGVPMGVKEPQAWPWTDELIGGRRRVEEVVRELMGDGEEAEGRRRRASEIGIEARRAMEACDGVSRRTLTALFRDAAGRARK